MTDIQFRAGRFYSLPELAELARRSMKAKGITQAQAADVLNETHDPSRGQYHRPQVSAALNDPEHNPGMVLLLVETFSDYKTDQQPRYQLERKS